MRFFKDMAMVFRNEWRLMLHDPGVILFFIVLPLLYPIIYTLIYNPEVVREVPVVIVDDCRTPQSRQLVREASAAPAFKLYGYAANMDEARALWAEQRVYAILHIPSDFSRNIENGQQAHTTLYCDMSLLLRYRALLSAMTALRIELSSEITQQRVMSAGEAAAGLGGLPIKSESHFLGDTQQGFASFVIPGIVVLILQQSMILGICLLGGTARERRRRVRGSDPQAVAGTGCYAAVWGKTLAYTICYIPMAIYTLMIVPWMFDLPHSGDHLQYILFILPMLLASGFLGQSLIALVYEREYVFLVIVFTSVIVLFLSGLTWPRYAMDAPWIIIGNLIPGTWGVEGFVRLNSNGATIAENATPYAALWIQVACYSVLAALVLRYLRNEGKKLALKTN